MKLIFDSTGMKCLPTSQVALANGSVLHDWHAEIVALRAFNQLLLQECLELASSPSNPSSIIRRREAHEVSELDRPQPFTIRDDLQLHMYSSEAPCGDASMELLMEHKPIPPPGRLINFMRQQKIFQASSAVENPLQSLASYAESQVRILPYVLEHSNTKTDDTVARADSPQTLSKSCSDKLALRQCTSILSSCTSLLVNPANAYLQSLILPKSQYVEHACRRSFSPDGRMKPVANQQWSGGYTFRPFKVRTTDHEFACSRRSKPVSSKVLRTSNVAAVYNPRLQEALVVGRLQGRQKSDPRAASAICNKRMWKTALQVLAALGTPRLLQQMSESSHVRKWKESALFKDRQRVKADVRSKALHGWIRNEIDDFEVESE